MLRYFRINDPYRLLGLLVLLVLLYLPLLLDPAGLTVPELKSILVGEKVANGERMYGDIADNTGPLAAWFHALMDILFGRSLTARHIVALVLVFFQAAYLGVIFITKKVFNENTFIPSLIFTILFLFSFDTMALSDELLGFTFLLMALNNLFKEIEFRMQRDETTFNLGLYIGFASLFYLPYFVFLFAVLIILFLFARTSARKYLLLVFGYGLPHLFVICFHYLSNSLPELWSYYYMSSIVFGEHYFVGTRGLLTLGALPLIYLAISIFMLNRMARFSKYQSQLLQSMFLWIGFCFIFILFCRDLRPQTLIVFIPGFAFLFTYFLLLIRRRKFAEMNTWILVIGVIGASYLARYSKLRAVDYGKLLVPSSTSSYKSKKLLCLDENFSIYQSHYASSPFINWELARSTFEHPELYENLLKVYESIRQSRPELIVDPKNYLAAFMERMPELKKMYLKEGNVYRLR